MIKLLSSGNMTAAYYLFLFLRESDVHGILSGLYLQPISAIDVQNCLMTKKPKLSPFISACGHSSRQFDRLINSSTFLL
jgi:hypothetical protein